MSPYRALRIEKLVRPRTRRLPRLAHVFGAAVLTFAVHAQAAGAVDGFVVRFFDDNPVAQREALDATAQAELEAALGVAVRANGRTVDGAYRFAFASSLPTPDARAALNKLRATGAVVYAELDEGDVRAAFAKARAATEPGRVHRILVRYRDVAKSVGGPVVRPERAARAAQAAGQRVEAERALGGDHVALKLARPVSPAEAQRIADALAQDPEVAYAEVDRVAKPQAMASDPMFSSQWNLTDNVGGIGAPPAWDMTTGAPGVRIAVLDSGRLPHPDLAARYVGGYDFVADPLFSNDGDGRDPDPSDPGDWVTSAEVSAPDSVYQTCTPHGSSWHGTQVATVLAAAANNGTGLAGVTWQNPIVPIRVLGKCGAVLSDIADGIRWAAGLSVPNVPANANPARVISVSIIGTGACGATLQSAVTAATQAGAIVVAAAGNDSDDVANHWPANCNGVVAVGGTTRAGGRASFSNVGAKISLMAPAGGGGSTITTARNISATSPDPSGWAYIQGEGTSLAAPQVAGVAALILSRDPSLTAADVVSLLESNARAFPTGTGSDCTRVVCGAGIVDASAAVRAVSAARPLTLPASIALHRRGSATFFVDQQPDGTPDLRVVYGVTSDVGVAGRFGTDGRMGFAVYRNGAWYLDANRDGRADTVLSFGGGSGDVPLAASFSGDARDDLVIYRAGVWYVDNAASRDGRVDRTFRFGGDPADVPLAGDIDGDGIADLVIYRRGMWHIDFNRDGIADRTVGFGGAPQDIPVLVDANGDGRMDLAVFRDGVWYVTTDLSGRVSTTWTFGQAGDVPLTGGRYQ